MGVSVRGKRYHLAYVAATYILQVRKVNFRTASVLCQYHIAAKCPILNETPDFSLFSMESLMMLGWAKHLLFFCLLYMRL